MGQIIDVRHMYFVGVAFGGHLFALKGIFGDYEEASAYADYYIHKVYKRNYGECPSIVIAPTKDLEEVFKWPYDICSCLQPAKQKDPAKEYIDQDLEYTRDLAKQMEDGDPE